MDSQDITFKVKLDMAQARAELGDFLRGAGASGGAGGGAVGAGGGGGGGGFGNAIGRGAGMLGLGGALGAGVGAITGPTQGALGGAISEALGGLGVKLEQSVFGSLGQEARAMKRTREEAINAFSTIVGQQGKVSPAVYKWFDQINAIRLREERGRTIMEQDPHMRIDPREVAAHTVNFLLLSKEAGIDSYAHHLVQRYMGHR